jgi:hypothetical protein
MGEIGLEDERDADGLGDGPPIEQGRLESPPPGGGERGLAELGTGRGDHPGGHHGAGVIELTMDFGGARQGGTIHRGGKLGRFLVGHPRRRDRMPEAVSAGATVPGVDRQQADQKECRPPAGRADESRGRSGR